MLTGVRIASRATGVLSRIVGVSHHQHFVCCSTVCQLESRDDRVGMAIHNTARISVRVSISLTVGSSSDKVASIMVRLEGGPQGINSSLVGVGSRSQVESFEGSSCHVPESGLNKSSLGIGVVTLHFGPSFLHDGDPQGLGVFRLTEFQRVRGGLGVEEETVVNCNNPWFSSNEELDTVDSSVVLLSV